MPSFDDLITSARGPGVIGTVLALIVLLGFSGLFLLVCDESPKGSAGLSLAGVVKNHESEIEALHSRVSMAQKNLETIPVLEKKVADIEAISSSTRVNKGAITGLQNRVSILRENIGSAQKDLLAYKAKYRASMRDKAKGEQIAEITTLAGRTFRHVAVREVTPIGMQIRHDDGFTRIPYEDLPHALQERFQFDPQEKREAVKAESSSEQVHLNNVAEADAAGQVQAIANREKQNQEDKQKAISQIALLETQIKAIDGDIADLQSQASNARSQTSSAKAAGRMVVDHTNNYLYSIQSKKNQRVEVQNQIQSLRTKL